MALASGNYRVSVREFGPIAEAQVEARPLTVFVGPSNTGKSYLAVLIYALHRCFSGAGPGPAIADFHRRAEMDLLSSRVPAGEIEAFRSWLGAIPSPDSLPPIPASILARIRHTVEGGAGLARHFADSLPKYYGLSHAGELNRHGASEPAAVELECGHAAHGPTRFRFGFTDDDAAVVSGQIAESLAREGGAIRSFREDLAEDPSPRRTDDESAGRAMLRRFVSRVADEAVSPVQGTPHFLPADRGGMIRSLHGIVGNLLAGAADPDLQGTDGLPSFTVGVADFLTRMSRAGAPGRLQSPKELGDLATRLEDEVLAGRVEVALNAVGFPRFTYRPRGSDRPLSLLQSSSMVSELAPVVETLRAGAQPGQILIIEEPEAHLHPATQAPLVHLIAGVVRTGVRVLLTTHSEWVMETVGNLVSASRLPEAARTRIAGSDATLTPEEVGVWLFRAGGDPGGSTVEEIALDPEVGLYPAGYDDIADALHNNSVRISNEMRRLAGS